MHLLISLFPYHRASTPIEVDSVIHTFWPDHDTEPVLFDVVKQCMVYEPYR